MEKNSFTSFLGVFFIVFTVIFIQVMRFKSKYSNKNYSLLEEWARNIGFKFYSSNKQAIKNRFSASPGKKFCWTYLNFNVPFVGYSGPYIEGVFKDRKVWLYRINGRTIFSGKNSFQGWCLELATHQIPLSIGISFRKFHTHDEVETESNEFENLYSVDIYNGKDTLQLLDPMMMALIIDSKLPIIEFSDLSVVIYSLKFPPSKEELDNTLNIGMRIAEQIDHNFPLNKI